MQYKNLHDKFKFISAYFCSEKTVVALFTLGASTQGTLLHINIVYSAVSMSVYTCMITE